jgi:hypothetical protein
LIRSSLNVSSVVRNAVGDYTINFTTPISDSNYLIIGSGSYGTQQGGAAFILIFPNIFPPGTYSAPTPSSCRITSLGLNSSFLDPENIYISIIR